MVHEFFKKLKIRYLEPPELMIDGWVFSKEKTLKAVNGSPFVIDFSQENYGDNSVSFYYHHLKDLNVNFILLSFNPNDHLIEPNILFYPAWYIWSKQNFENISALTDNRHYKISCLNRNPRPHRILNFLLLKNKKYFNDILFTFQNADQGADRSDDIILPVQLKKEWEQIRQTLPSFFTSENIKHCAYTDSYINFVTETTVTEGLFITEKTWKPVASEQLFVVYGNKGIIHHLRDIGVDVFDDIIDHDYYDNESDPQERLIRIHSIIESLIEQDLNQIFATTKTRRKQNRINFLQGIFVKNYLDLVERKCIEMQK